MKWKEAIWQSKGRIGGFLCGMISAVLFLTIGFWPTLLIIALSFAGYTIGFKHDMQLTIRELFGKVIGKDGN